MEAFLFFSFFFSPYLLLDKPDDKALSAHEVTSPLWNWNNSIQSQNKGPWLAYIFRWNGCIPLSSTVGAWSYRGLIWKWIMSCLLFWMTIQKKTIHFKFDTFYTTPHLEPNTVWELIVSHLALILTCFRKGISPTIINIITPDTFSENTRNSNFALSGISLALKGIKLAQVSKWIVYKWYSAVWVIACYSLPFESISCVKSTLLIRPVFMFGEPAEPASFSSSPSLAPFLSLAFVLNYWGTAVCTSEA